MTKISSMLPVLAIAIFASCAQGACGGGGWSKSASHSIAAQPNEVITPSDDLNESARVMSVKAGSAPQSRRFDTTQFDKLSTSMQISEDQRAKISSSKAQIQKRIDVLKTAYENAQNVLVNCNGRCVAEGKSLESATRELKAFDANLAFFERLSHILNTDQFAHLDTADRVSKRQGI
jgi:hypothetical protein